MTFPRSAILLLINAVVIIAVIIVMAKATEKIDIDNKDLIIITGIIGGMMTFSILIEVSWASVNTDRDDGRPNVMESQGNERGEGY
jgi:fluoride ion exporter CrcB/FEX